MGLGRVWLCDTVAVQLLGCLEEAGGKEFRRYQKVLQGRITARFVTVRTFK